MTVTPVGMRCPECAKQKTKARTISAGSDEPVLTYILIGISVLVWLGGALSGASATGSGGLGGSTLINDGSVSRLTIEQGDYWRLLTAGFLHSGFLHLLFNMFALYVLGTLLEPAIGMPRFLGVYFTALLAGSFGALLLSPDQNTVGASGAIFGIFAAAFVIARGRGLEGVASQIGLILLLNVVFTFSVPGLSIGGHLGGIVGGGLAALLVMVAERRVGGRNGRLLEAAGMLAISAISVAGALAVA
jgi:membrane associated rhomboid family serine protease